MTKPTTHTLHFAGIVQFVRQLIHKQIDRFFACIQLFFFEETVDYQISLKYKNTQFCSNAIITRNHSGSQLISIV